MKLNFPNMIDEYRYIIDNIISENDNGDLDDWYNEYMDYLLNGMITDIELIKTYKFRSEKIKQIKKKIYKI